jgi:flagellar motor switch/type III secretory pathway protein FliN
MSARTIPYLLLGETRRKKLEACVAAAASRWHREWLPEQTQPIRAQVEELRARPIDIRAHEAVCFGVSVEGTESLVFIVPRRSLAGLVGAPSHGADASSRFADDRSLAAALEREALVRLARTLLPHLNASDIELERLALGAVDVAREYDSERYVCTCITIGDTRCVLDVLFAPSLVEKLMPQRPPAPDTERVEKRRSAVAAQEIGLDGVLGVAEVSVSELAALCVGDVIVLEQMLADAGAIAVRGGERIGSAALGRVDGKRAIQIKGRAA